MELKMEKLAAIDIGSNSIRLLIVNALPDEKGVVFRKSSMTRLPVRLGSDVFMTGGISEENTDRLVKALKAYKYIIEVNGVSHFRACATSAMREATNGSAVVEKIQKETGITIELIDGKEEASLIFETQMFEVIKPEEDSFIYIDVGGGSTEITILNKGKVVDSRSFKIGTIRLLNRIDQKEDWKKMRNWIREKTKGISNIAAIGSGGNINKVFKMSRMQQADPLSLNYLNFTMDYLDRFSLEEKVKKLGLNVDRADVIVPALNIYREAMTCSNAYNIYVPKVGVSDGIVRKLYFDVFEEAIPQ